MRILVFGATGFLGAWVVRALAGSGNHEVIAVVRPSSNTWRIDGIPGLKVITAAESDWANATRQAQPEVAILLDWAGVDSASRDTEIQWANLDRHRTIIEAAGASGVRRIIGVGSQAEYGPRADPTPETAETRPTTTYGRAKLDALHQLRTLSVESGMEWVWARVFSVFGPMDNDGLLLSTIASRLSAGEDVNLSSGEQRWSYLYGSDAGLAFQALVTQPGALGLYNVGHSDSPRLRETIERFAGYFPAGGKLRFAPSVPGEERSPNLIPIVDRLLGLGWSPTTSRDHGLHVTANWLKGSRVPDPLVGGRELPARPSAKGM